MSGIGCTPTQGFWAAQSPLDKTEMKIYDIRTGQALLITEMPGREPGIPAVEFSMTMPWDLLCVILVCSLTFLCLDNLF